MSAPRHTNYDQEQLIHERNMLGLKKTPSDEVSCLDKGLDWITKKVNEDGEQVYDNKPIGVAIFGLGRIGTIHLEGVIGNPRILLKYCVEDNLERANYASFIWRLQDRGTKLVTSTSTATVITDPEVDAILVCVNTLGHEQIVVAALNAGKAVFCEKPLAKGYEAIKRCYDLARSKSLPILCAFNRRFDPSHVQLRDRVRSGEIGNVHVVKTTSRDSPRPSIAYLSTSGGIYQDCAVHDIDLICWVLGEWPLSVFSVGHAFTDDIREINDFDTLVITMKFPSGAIGVIDVSRHATYGYDIRLEAFGSGGMLTANEKRPTQVTFHADQGSTIAPIFYSFPSRFREAYIRELDHFVDMVKNQTAGQVTSEETLNVDKITVAAEASARSGKVINLEF